jgi:hypothetical protein
MIDEPRIATLPERPYVAIAATVGMDDLATVVPPLNGEVFGWLAARAADLSTVSGVIAPNTVDKSG